VLDASTLPSGGLGRFRGHDAARRDLAEEACSRATADQLLPDEPERWGGGLMLHVEARRPGPT